jgi:hypothetical protein
MRTDPREKKAGECWRESSLQERLRRSIRRLAVKSALRELFGRCEHREFVDDLEAKLLLADSPEVFKRVAHAIADHLRGCRTAAAGSSPVAKGIQLYTDLNSEHPGTERAAGDFLAEVALTEQPLPALTMPPGEQPMDAASYPGYAVAAGVKGNRPPAAMIAAAKRRSRSVRDRWSRVPAPPHVRDRS